MTQVRLASQTVTVEDGDMAPEPRRPAVLSIENELAWSWGNAILDLIPRLPAYEFVRVRRGLYYCQHESCGAAHVFPVDEGLENHFNLILIQNHDGVRYLKHREKTVMRIGGIVMTAKLDPNRYAEDFKKVGAIIATNELLASFARPVNPNVTVIPNGVDLDLFKPRPGFPERPQRFDDNGRPVTFVIGFAGNIDGMGNRYKGWKYFMQAGVYLGMEGVGTKYVLYRHNQIPHDRMPEDFYHQIDALILPSQGEGCSNVITEALACGVPVICTKVGFHGEKLVHYDNVVYIDRNPDTVSSETTDQICAAVRRLMREPELYRRLSVNSRAFAVEHHDVRQVALQYDRVFQSILSERTAKHDGSGHEQTHRPGDLGGGGHLDRRD